MMLFIGFVSIMLLTKSIYWVAVWLLNSGLAKREIFRKSIPWMLLSLLADGVIFGVTESLDVGLVFRLQCVIASSLLQIALVYFCVFMAKRRRPGSGFSLWNVFLCFFPLSQIQVIFYLSQDDGYSNLIFGAITAIIGILGAVLLMYIVYGLWEKKNLDEALKNQEKELELLWLNRETVAEDEVELEKLHAKYTKELNEIYALYQKQSDRRELEDMLNALEKEIASTKETYCGNLIVNSILEEKARLCSKSAINLKISVKLAENAGISRLHLCSIFSNLLNNAIGECNKLENEADRWIEVKCDRQGDYLAVMVKNPARKPLRRLRRSGAAREHGWGLKILEDIAVVYNGYFRFRQENGEFRAMLLLQPKEAAEDVLV